MLRKVREYMCKRMGVMDNAAVIETSHAAAVVSIRAAQPKAAIEMQLGDLQIKFNESPDSDQLKVVLGALVCANKPVC